MILNSPLTADYTFRTIYDIRPQTLASAGIRLLLADLDNTLVPYGVPEPTEAVRVGFEYHLQYRTDYRIASRSQLVGFDRIYLGSGRMSLFGLANPYPDRREEFQAGYSYRCIIFGFVDGEAYRLVAERTTASGVEEVVVAELASRTALVSTTRPGPYGQLRLDKRVSAGGGAPGGGRFGYCEKTVASS